MIGRTQVSIGGYSYGAIGTVIGDAFYGDLVRTYQIVVDDIPVACTEFISVSRCRQGVKIETYIQRGGGQGDTRSVIVYPNYDELREFNPWINEVRA